MRISLLIAVSAMLVAVAGLVGAADPPATAPANRELRICIGLDDLYLNGKQADQTQIRSVMNAIKPEARAQTIVEISAASLEVSVERYEPWKEMIQDWAADVGLPTVKEVGVEDEPPEAETQMGEYYMGGDLQRPGVYSLTRRRISLKMAIISAGLPHDDLDGTQVTVVRKQHGLVSHPIEQAVLRDVLSGKVEDLYLKPDDQIMVAKLQAPVTEPATQPATSQPK